MAVKKIDSVYLDLNTGSLKQSDQVNLTEFSKLLGLAAQNLEAATAHVQASEVAVRHWDDLVRQWADDSTMPLYVRKSEAGFARGSVAVHEASKRQIIFADNGPAHWALSMALNENFLGLADVKTLIDSDEIPISFVMGRAEAASTYRFCRHEIDQPNKKGWKVAHIELIGLRTNRAASQIPIETLKAHFVNFLSPANMFLIPSQYSGLAECQDVIEVFRRRRNG